MTQIAYETSQSRCLFCHRCHSFSFSDTSFLSLFPHLWNEGRQLELQTFPITVAGAALATVLSGSIGAILLVRPLALPQSSLFMPTDQPWNVYREQLSSLYLGIALWEPEPVKGFYDKVSIGDVGYIYNGFFYRMFNVKLPWDDLSNQKISKDPPENYKAMDLDLFAIHTTRFKKGDYCSPRVVRYENTEYMQARVPRE